MLSPENGHFIFGLQVQSTVYAYMDVLLNQGFDLQIYRIFYWILIHPCLQLYIQRLQSKQGTGIILSLNAGYRWSFRNPCLLLYASWRQQPLHLNRDLQQAKRGCFHDNSYYPLARHFFGNSIQYKIRSGVFVNRMLCAIAPESHNRFSTMSWIFVGITYLAFLVYNWYLGCGAG